MNSDSTHKSKLFIKLESDGTSCLPEKSQSHINLMDMGSSSHHAEPPFENSLQWTDSVL